MALGVVLGTDLLSQWLSGSDREEQKRLEEEALAIYGDASPPTLERMLQERLGPSAMEAIPEDFGNRNARNAALQQILSMGLQGGMDEGSMLALEQARRASAASEAQGRGAVRQEFARRGLGGAGEAIMQQQAQQAGADRASMEGMQAASDARMRALQALATGGGMAAQAEGQDFERAARIADSKDSIARFNSQLATNAIQQDWNNRLGLMDRRYDATLNRAGQKGRDAGATQRRVDTYGQAAGQTLGALGNAFGAPTGPAQLTQPPASGYDPNDPRFRRPK